MRIQRQWVTPMTAGAFLLLAVTGVLMFFHADSGLNKLAHEWLSWLLLAGAALHVKLNFGALRQHLRRRGGQLAMAVFVAALALSFVPAGEEDGPPFRVPVEALAHAPLTTLAEVGGVSVQEMMARLARVDAPASSAGQSVAELAGDPRRQLAVLAAVLAPAARQR